jgi:CysZ protein
MVFAFGIYVFYKTNTRFTEYLMQQTNLKQWLQSNNTILSFLLVTTIVMIDLVFMFFYFSLFRYLFLIICAPVFSYLGWRVQGLIEPQAPQNRGWTKGIVRHLRTSLRNCLWQTVYFLALVVLSLIPVAGWIVPLVALMVECYYTGFSMLDDTCYRKGLSEAPSQEFIGRHQGLAIGNGLVFYLFHFIPMLGWILAPVYARVAGVVSVNRVDGKTWEEQ